MFENDLVTWIAAIDIPVIGGLAWFMFKIRTELEDRIRHLVSILDTRTSQLRESIASHKLEVSKIYAARNDVKELETRVIAHLLRIEAKLDTTALKTEALSAESKKP